MQSQFLILSSGLLLLLLIAVVAWRSQYASSSPYESLRGDGISGHQQDEATEEELQVEEDKQEAKLRKFEKKQRKRGKEPTLDERLFMAGKITTYERNDFHRKRKLAPVVLGLLGLVCGLALGGPSQVLLGGLIGAILGFYLPLKFLSSWQIKQQDELSYFLPLVIEQVAIGVSSSLDVGPCLSKIVEMADERGSHNAVTRLLKHALMHVKSGVSLEEALSEIGVASGHPEFKHATLALSQVAKFGGEISKQLQDLADSVATQREAKVEATIRKLELKATGPVMLVFIAYMMLLGLGIASNVIGKF